MQRHIQMWLRTTSTRGRHYTPAERLVLDSVKTDIQPTLIFLSLLNILVIVRVLTWTRNYRRYIRIPKLILIDKILFSSKMPKLLLRRCFPTVRLSRHVAQHCPHCVRRCYCVVIEPKVLTCVSIIMLWRPNNDARFLHVHHVLKLEERTEK